MGFDPVMFVAGGAGLTVILIFWAGVSLAGSHRERSFHRRLARAQGIAPGSSPGDPDAPTLRLATGPNYSPTLDRLMKRYMPNPALLRQRLDQAGLKFSLGDYMLVSICVALLAGVFSVMVTGRGVAVGALAGIAAGFAIPHFALNWLIAKRLKAFMGEFPEAIDLIVRGLKSGLPVAASFRSVAQEIRDPVGKEFGIITDRLRIGENMDDALKLSADRIPAAEFRFFVISLAVQRETGGNLAETLENLSDVLRKRRLMRQKIKAMSSEAKASAIILGSLPFLMFGIMMLLNPQYVSTLFVDPRGMAMVVMGMSSLVIGIFTMAKMVRFEV